MTKSSDRARLRRIERMERSKTLGSSDPKLVDAARKLVKAWWPRLEGEAQDFAIKEAIDYFEGALLRSQEDPNWLKAYKRPGGEPYTENQFARMMISSFLRGMGYLEHS